MAVRGNPSTAEVEGEARLITRAPCCQNTLVQNELRTDERNPLEAVGMVIQPARRQTLSLPDPSECDVRLKGRPLRRKADRLASALDAILEQLQGGWCIHADP